MRKFAWSLLLTLVCATASVGQTTEWVSHTKPVRYVSLLSTDKTIELSVTCIGSKVLVIMTFKYMPEIRLQAGPQARFSFYFDKDPGGHIETWTNAEGNIFTAPGPEDFLKELSTSKTLTFAYQAFKDTDPNYPGFDSLTTVTFHTAGVPIKGCPAQ